MKNIKCKLFGHYDAIVYSKYWTFNDRKCVLKCKRCNRYIVELINHDYVYPIETAVLGGISSFYERIIKNSEI